MVSFPKYFTVCITYQPPLVYILLIVVCSYVVYNTYQCIKPWLLLRTRMVAPIVNGEGEWKVQQ